MQKVTLTVNGAQHALELDTRTSLLDALREHIQLTGTKKGCDHGQCGACTVIINGVATRSCVTPVSTVRSEVTTLEGLGAPARPDRVQQAFIDAQAFQCGYCLNGWVMTTKALLDSNPRPTESQIRAAFDGLVCRCGSHVRILDAVRQLAGTRQA